MKRKNLSALFFGMLVCGLLFSPGLRGEDLPPLPAGPLLLTSIRPEQLQADYWISRMKNPDQVLITPAGLHEFNQDIRAMIPDSVDIFKMPQTRPGQQVRDQLELEYETIKGRHLFDAAGKKIDPGIFEPGIREAVAWEKVPKKISMRWGIAIEATSVRALPTPMKMLEAPADIEFDQLQFTLIKLWTPVGIFHTSSDGRWYYVQAPYVRGWVRASDIVEVPDRWSLEKYAHQAPFLMVTAESIPVFSDSAFMQFAIRPSMGSRLPLAGQTDQAYEIWLPRHPKSEKDSFLKKAYVRKKEDVSRGFLSYTKRNVIRQAFKLLGARYGWGGTYGGRDCSGFIHDVFLTFGIDMPRDSGQQGYIGTQVSHFPRGEDPGRIAYFIRRSEPGITLLRMSMHMMLYLGEENGNFYAIHSTWAERISMTSDERNRINQVIVSDLSLNGNSYLGPLLARIISINKVR